MGHQGAQGSLCSPVDVIQIKTSGKAGGFDCSLWKKSGNAGLFPQTESEKTEWQSHPVFSVQKSMVPLMT